jgi:hypothetical protein
VSRSSCDESSEISSVTAGHAGCSTSPHDDPARSRLRDAACGVIIGGIIGAIAGLLAAFALTRHARMDTFLREELDEELGVIGGDIGAPNLKHPPATTGLDSSESLGISSTESGLAEVEGQFPIREG